MRHRTLRRALLFPVLGALTLTACADDEDDGGGGTASGEQCVRSTDIDTVLPEASDTGGEGTEETTPPAGDDTGETYTIAYMGPLSGQSPQLGIDISRSVQLAIEQANDSGELPFTLEFVEADAQGIANQGPPTAQRLISNPEVVAVIGPTFSGVANAAMPLFDEAGLMAVSPSNTLPSLTEQDWSAYARVVLPDTVQGEQAAGFIAEHAEKVVIVDDASDYGVGLAEVIKNTLEDEGVEVVQQGAPADSTQDYTTVAQAVVQEDPDAVYYAGYYQQAGPFAQALAGAGYECMAMSGDGSNNDRFMELAGADAEGWMFTCPCADARSDPRATQFLDDYKARWDADPATFSPEGYDATNAVIQAMVGIDGEVNRESMIEAVKNVSYDGITKQIQFDESGDIEGEDIYIYGVEDGDRVLKGLVPDLME